MVKTMAQRLETFDEYWGHRNTQLVYGSNKYAPPVTSTGGDFSWAEEA